jgi:hypothetical protein
MTKGQKQEELMTDMKNALDILWVLAISLEHNTKRENFLAQRDAKDGQKLCKELLKKYETEFGRLGVG